MKHYCEWNEIELHHPPVMCKVYMCMDVAGILLAGMCVAPVLLWVKLTGRNK